MALFLSADWMSNYSIYDKIDIGIHVINGILAL